MNRIYFTVEDLAQTRIVTAKQSVAETLFAMELIRRGTGGAFFGAWHRSIRRRLGTRAHAMAVLARSARLGYELLPPAKGTSEPLELKLTSHWGGDTQLTALVNEFYKVALAPYGKPIHDYLEADRIFRGEVLLNGGVDALFSTLHPCVAWNAPVLEVDAPMGQDIHLEGRGLLIMPSLFLFDRLTVISSPDHPYAPPLLIYPTTLDKASASRIWNTPEASEQALSALVGNTRARILKSLTKSYTTSELGRLIGISAAAASQNTAILRQAGLITTRRKSNEVFHTLTPLGAALVQGQPFGDHQVRLEVESLVAS
ncbi:ArsR/SmtB family transcription factor [Streptosporangium carneum]|uniref:Transcriptional regulator n=1 Tax=Streptosporangium carneum TaxID=47481 RepID=A0A9W6I7E7_9ACTN|nr:winged helix-turn-helix domain-containing protein [Streptosporangium carneum]GLK12350.1 transcriptional regulator [Streptosporangium carneum]